MDNERTRLLQENRELRDELSRQSMKLAFAVRRQNSLIDAGRAMSGILSIEELLNYFIGCVANELDVERASLMLLDEATQEMQIVAHRGLAPDVASNVRMKLGNGIAGSVALEGKPILVTDVESDMRVEKSLGTISAASFISAPIVLSIPVQLQEKVLGVINVTNRRSGEPFNEDDMAFLLGLAGQAAVAIERARQFEELRKACRRLQETQERLVESERLKAIGRIAADVAHEFNNLLTGVLGQAELLGVHLSDPSPDIKASLQRAELLGSLARQGADTVRRMQDFTRIRKDAPSGVVDMNAVVRKALDGARREWEDERWANVSVRLEAGLIPMTTGDEAELVHVVSNLILNAVEALGAGGNIVLSTWSDGREIVLSVTDSGEGMPLDIQRRIFDPYFTTKERSQGLGMSVIYGIVTRHRGEISVRSEEGYGTTFELRLPVAAPQAKDFPDGAEEAAIVPARVLIVEDSDPNRELFVEYISMLKHKVLEAANGMEALSILDREQVDLVVTDLNMPGLTGWDVAEAVKKRRPGVPVILISGWAVLQDEPRIRQSGIRRVLQKPCAMAGFQKAVQEELAFAAAAQG